MSHFTAHTHSCAHARTHSHPLTHMREHNRANESYLHTGHVTDISGMHFFFFKKKTLFVRNSFTGLEL